MKGAWTAVEGLRKRLDTVEASVRNLARPAASGSREITTLMTQPVRVEVTNPINLTERVATFYNGDRDEIVLQRLAGYVEVQSPELNSLSKKPVTVAARVPDGFAVYSFSDVQQADDNLPVGMFDFLWGYEIGTRQSRYSRDLVSSDSLAGLGDRGSMINFRTPLRIGRGETVQFRVRPLYIDYRSLITTTGGFAVDLMVVFVGLGFRRAP